MVRDSDDDDKVKVARHRAKVAGLELKIAKMKRKLRRLGGRSGDDDDVADRFARRRRRLEEDDDR